jgi:CYTH domain-containing protein
MAFEIERKFLIKGDYKADAVASDRIIQGYIASSPACAVRVRLYGDKGYLTIKGPTDVSGLKRLEWEKEITSEDVRELLTLCGGKVIDKTRYRVPVGNHVFEVDEFHGDNEGLVVAEVELSSEDESYERPSWLGEEVTGRPEYYNSMLLKSPYNSWGR